MRSTTLRSELYGINSCGRTRSEGKPRRIIGGRHQPVQPGMAFGVPTQQSLPSSSLHFDLQKHVGSACKVGKVYFAHEANGSSARLGFQSPPLSPALRVGITSGVVLSGGTQREPCPLRSPRQLPFEINPSVPLRCLESCAARLHLRRPPPNP